MIITGKHICKYCNKEFEWYHIPTVELGSSHKIFEKIPKDKIGFCNVIKDKNDNGYFMPLEATAYCPKCGRLNTIEILKE